MSDVNAGHLSRQRLRNVVVVMEQFASRRQRLRNVYVVWNDLTPTAVATVVFGNDLTPTAVAIVEQFLQSGEDRGFREGVHTCGIPA